MVNIVQPLVGKMVMGFCRASFWPVEVFKLGKISRLLQS